MLFKNKKVILIAAILITGISFNLSYIAVTNTYVSHEEKTIMLDIVKEKNSTDLIIVENEIKKMQSDIPPKDISSINFKDHFSSTVVVGDSQVQGLTAYDVLNKSSVVAKLGNNLGSAKTTAPQTIKTLAPTSVITLFGVNDILIYQKNIELFIADYKTLLDSIKKELPSSKIIVSAIFPVSENAIKNRPIYNEIHAYNKALESFCTENNYTFVDSSYIVTNNPNFVAPDGMHFSQEFYRHWLYALKDYI